MTARTPARASAPGGLLRIGPLAVPATRRGALLGGLLVVLILIAGVMTLTMGTLGVPLPQLLPSLLDSPGGKIAFTLERLRGPRLLVAGGVGVALGLSGALFQTVTRNPLGSPDLIGVGAGAGAGVAVSTLLWPGVVPASVGALTGAVTAVLVVGLSTGRWFAVPARVIIAGIGVAAMAYAVTQYVVSVELRDSASQLATYLAGSVSAVDLGDAALVGAVVVVLTPALVALGPRLSAIDLGDTLADALGARAVHTRTLAILLSVLLAAAAVTVAGPIAFVALTAPHIAKRLSGSPGPNLLLSALIGALIMVLADLVVQQADWADGLPVGVLTAGVGGLYLGYLLVLEWRRGRM